MSLSLYITSRQFRKFHLWSLLKIMLNVSSDHLTGDCTYRELIILFYCRAFIRVSAAVQRRSLGTSTSSYPHFFGLTHSTSFTWRASPILTRVGFLIAFGKSSSRRDVSLVLQYMPVILNLYLKDELDQCFLLHQPLGNPSTVSPSLSKRVSSGFLLYSELESAPISTMVHISAIGW